MFGMSDRGHMGESAGVVLGGSFERGNSHSKLVLSPQYPPVIPKSIVNWNHGFPAQDSFRNFFLERGECTSTIWNAA